MSFNLHSVADGGFLAETINNLAILTGSGELEQVAAIGAVIGLVIASSQNIMNNGQSGLQYGQVLFGWILFMLMFSTTETVVIEDSYTGEVHVVDNVPYGIAASGFIISTVGYELTELYEQSMGGYSGITSAPFADSLEILQDIRTKAYNDATMTALNAQLGNGEVDFHRSIQNFIKECTLVKYDLGLANSKELKSTDLIQSLQFVSPIYHVELFLNTAGPEVKSCSDAYPEITAALSQVSSPIVEKALNGIVGIDSTTPSGNTWSTSLGNTLNEMGILGTSAQDFVKVSIVEPILYEAAQGRYDDWQDTTTAIAMADAIQRRNIAWAAEQTFFEGIMQPLMSFFESVVYAITPMMAFLIPMGLFGVKIAMKYFQTLVWVQLWMPMMAVVNHYIIYKSNEQIGNTYLANADNSIYLLDVTSAATQNWIAVGGKLAASVPMLSFIFVTGSAYAMSSLIGRFNQDNANAANDVAKQTNPQAMEVGSLMSVAGMGTKDASGTKLSGAEKALGEVQLGKSFDKQMSSGQQNLDQSIDQFSDTWQKAYASATASGNNLAISQGFNSAMQHSESKGIEKVNAIAEKHDNVRTQLGMTDAQFRTAIATELAGQGSIGAKGSAGVSFFGNGATVNTAASVSASAGLSMNGSKGGSKSDQFSELQAELKSNQFSEKESSQFMESVAKSWQQTGTTQFSDTDTATKTDSISHAASQVKQDSETFSELESASTKAAISSSYTPQQVSDLMSDDTKQKMAEYFMNNKDAQAEAKALADSYARFGFSDNAGSEMDAARAFTLMRHMDSNALDISGDIYRDLNGEGGFNPLKNKGLQNQEMLSVADASKGNVADRIDEARTAKLAKEQPANAISGSENDPVTSYKEAQKLQMQKEQMSKRQGTVASEYNQAGGVNGTGMGFHVGTMQALDDADKAAADFGNRAAGAVNQVVDKANSLDFTPSKREVSEAERKNVDRTVDRMGSGNSSF